MSKNFLFTGRINELERKIVKVEETLKEVLERLEKIEIDIE